MVDLIGQTNARSAKATTPPVFEPGKFLHVRSVADQLVRGPDAILLRHGAAGREYAFERIARIVIDTPNRRLDSWAVFRRATWDVGADLASQSRDRGRIPHTSSVTQYISMSYDKDLRDAMAPVDESITAGISFTLRPLPEIMKWDEVSLSRALDWGLVDLTWNASVTNDALERSLITLKDTIDRILGALGASSTGAVESMTMVYEPSPYLEELQPTGAVAAASSITGDSATL